jgi:hypothetical protein
MTFASNDQWEEIAMDTKRQEMKEGYRVAGY